MQIKPKPSQYKFLMDEHQYAAGIAGWGGGKTYIGAVKSLQMAVANPGITICVTAPTYNMLSDTVIPCYEQVFPKEYAVFVRGASPEARLLDKGKIIFRSTDKPENLVGMNLGAVHMDEAARSPYAAFTNLKSRLRQQKKDGTFYPCRLWLTTTPKQLNWVYLEFGAQQKEDYWYIQWSTKENQENLPKGFIQGLGLTGKKYEQEIEGRFLLVEGDCLFNSENLSRILRDDCKAPLETYRNGLVKVWREPVVGAKYVAGLDCADEGGGGVNQMVMINHQNKEQVLSLGGDISADSFVKLVDEWGKRYNNCFLMPERNSTAGGWVTGKLDSMHYPSMHREQSGKIGMYTGTHTRDTMLEELKFQTDRNQWTIRDAEMVEEMNTFVSNIRGKYEHIEGGKDDLVMAAALCLHGDKSTMLIDGGGFKYYTRPNSTYASVARR